MYVYHRLSLLLSTFFYLLKLVAEEGWPAFPEWPLPLPVLKILLILIFMNNFLQSRVLIVILCPL